MGAQESKVESSKQKSKNEAPSIPETSTSSPPTPPILTPIDPRSPCVNIARTPIEVLLSSDDNQREKSVEDLPESIILGIDPRSPTVDFPRTPIIVTAAVSAKPTTFKLQNKNLENVRNSTIQTTPVRSVFKHTVAPKLLESSPLIFDSTKVNNRKSFIGLLETNIDFTETDLDQAALSKNSLSKSQQETVVEQVVESAVVDDLKYELVDHIIVPKDEPEEEMIVEKVKTEIDIEIPIELPVENIIEEEIVSQPEPVIAEEKSINITAHVKDFDKKLTHLIYQDESEDDANLVQRFTKLKENTRAPLASRNGNEDIRKGLSKLKVSDKPTKSKPDLSKIPVFKDIKKKGVQCENTPPRKMEDKRLRNKISRWDADKTFVI